MENVASLHIKRSQLGMRINGFSQFHFFLRHECKEKGEKKVEKSVVGRNNFSFK